MKFEITFENIGRKNHCSKHIKEFENLGKAEYWAYCFADSFLISSFTDLRKNINKGEYSIFAGFMNLGKVKIEVID